MIDINHSRKKKIMTISLILALVSCNGNSSIQSADLTVEHDNKIPAKSKISDTKKMKIKEQIAFSQVDLAARLEVDLDTVSLSGATPVSWRSGALGCPEPGVSYTDVLVPGIWIVLRVDKATYRYHAVPGGQPFYCSNDQAEPPVMGSGAD